MVPSVFIFLILFAARGSMIASAQLWYSFSSITLDNDSISAVFSEFEKSKILWSGYFFSNSSAQWIENKPLYFEFDSDRKAFEVFAFEEDVFEENRVCISLSRNEHDFWEEMTSISPNKYENGRLCSKVNEANVLGERKVHLAELPLKNAASIGHFSMHFIVQFDETSSKDIILSWVWLPTNKANFVEELKESPELGLGLALSSLSNHWRRGGALFSDGKHPCERLEKCSIFTMLLQNH